MNYILKTVIAFGLTASQSSAVTIVIPQASEITNLKTQSTQSSKAGEKTTLKEDPYWVQPEGRLPVIILPVYGKDSLITVDLPTIEETIKMRSEGYLDKELDQFLHVYNNFQNQIREKNYTRARDLLEQIKRNHPRVHYLRFLEASLLLLQKDSDGARLQLIEGLKHHPDNEEGKLLLEKLGGNNQ